MKIEFSRTRLATSPTGALHLGHARTFLLTWWMARQTGAKVFMRMEDLDAGRAKAESVEQAYEDLRWVGMEWDAYEETRNAKHGTRNEVLQSERAMLYHDALEELWRRGEVYPCTCTRADVVASVMGSASAPHEGEGHVRYPGTCRDKTQNKTLNTRNTSDVGRVIREETGKNVCWRLRVPAGTVAFHDVIA